MAPARQPPECDHGDLPVSRVGQDARRQRLNHPARPLDDLREVVAARSRLPVSPMRVLKLQAWCARRTSAAGGRPGLATDVNANSTSSSSVPDTRIPSPPTRCYKRFDEQMTITITGVNGSCNKIALRAGPGPIRAYFRRRAKLLMNSSGRAASSSGCPDRGSRPKLQFAKRRLSIGSSRRMRRPE